MSESNGIIRIKRKGLKKFAFGEEGEPFEVDVVSAFQIWIGIDEEFRTETTIAKDGTPYKTIPTADMCKSGGYHDAAVSFVKELSKADTLTVAEALDFIARLREQYDLLVDFFHPKRPQEDDSPDTSGAELQFSAEPE